MLVARQVLLDIEGGCTPENDGESRIAQTAVTGLNAGLLTVYGIGHIREEGRDGATQQEDDSCDDRGDAGDQQTVLHGGSAFFRTSSCCDEEAEKIVEHGGPFQSQ